MSNCRRRGAHTVPLLVHIYRELKIDNLSREIPLPFSPLSDSDDLLSEFNSRRESVAFACGRKMRAGKIHSHFKVLYGVILAVADIY